MNIRCYAVSEPRQYITSKHPYLYDWNTRDDYIISTFAIQTAANDIVLRAAVLPRDVFADYRLPRKITCGRMLGFLHSTTYRIDFADLENYPDIQKIFTTELQYIVHHKLNPVQVKDPRKYFTNKKVVKALYRLNRIFGEPRIQNKSCDNETVKSCGIVWSLLLSPFISGILGYYVNFGIGLGIMLLSIGYLIYVCLSTPPSNNPENNTNNMV